MTREPRITIVTPSLNQAAFLEQTILSILDQDYANLEYIVMDGGSVDGSTDIIRKYSSRLAYWVSEKDAGQSDAINRGFARATGDILNWINSDDRLKPGALSSVAEAARLRPDAGAWIGACELVGKHGNLIDLVKPRGVHERSIMADWGNTGHFFQPSCFIAREAWTRFGPLDTSLWACFDFDFYLKARAAFPFYTTDKVWSEATIHRDAKTTAHVPRLRAERYLVQARHGFYELAMKNIEAAEQARISVQRFQKPFKSLLNVARRIKNSRR